MAAQYGGRTAIGRTLSSEERKNMPKITKELIWRVLSYLKPYKWHLLVVFLTIITASVLGVLPSILTGKMIDEGLYNQNLNLLIKLVIISFFVLMLSNLITAAEKHI